jgi:host factor-I protein
MAMSAFTELTKLQINFLDELVKKKSPIAVYLKNGIKLKGTLAGFDEHCFLLDHPSEQVIYKTAVSTIAPLLLFNMFEP